jgi:vacuolar-type H+-ATPase subunit F/Vma7
MSYSVVVQLALLSSVNEVKLEPLFWKQEKYALSAQVTDFPALSQSDELVLVERSEKSSKFLFFGNRLHNATVLDPPDTPISKIDGLSDNDSIGIVELTSAESKNYKQILVRKQATQRPILVAIPTPETKDKDKPTLTAKSRVTVEMDDVIVIGEGSRQTHGCSFQEQANPLQSFRRQSLSNIDWVTRGGRHRGGYPAGDGVCF